VWPGAMHGLLPREPPRPGHPVLPGLNLKLITRHLRSTVLGSLLSCEDWSLQGHPVDNCMRTMPPRFESPFEGTGLVKISTHISNKLIFKSLVSDCSVVRLGVVFHTSVRIVAAFSHAIYASSTTYSLRLFWFFIMESIIQVTRSVTHSCISNSDSPSLISHRRHCSLEEKNTCSGLTHWLRKHG